jgi:hypothetical protein
MKSKKINKRMHITIDEEIVERLKKHVESVGYDTSKLVESILKNFLKKVK